MINNTKINNDTPEQAPQTTPGQPNWLVKEASNNPQA